MPEETQNNDINITTDPELPIATTPDIEFEKLKLKMNFYKWLLGTFVISFITIIINWGFKDREVGMGEISQYDKYATDILILNDNPIKKRMIAQFFSTVTPSANLKCGWEAYYSKVDEEYQSYLKKNDSLYAIYDSLKQIEKPSTYETYKIKEIQNKLKLVETQEIAPIILPLLEKPNIVKLATTSSINGQYVIVFTADTDLPQAQYENKNLKKAGVPNPIIVNKGSLYFNISQNFNSKSEASSVIDLVRSKVRGDVYITPSAKFCKNKINVGNFFSCE